MIGSRPLLVLTGTWCPIFTSPDGLNTELYNVLTSDLPAIVNPVVAAHATICPDLTESDLMPWFVVVPAEDVVWGCSFTKDLPAVETPLAPPFISHVGLVSVDRVYRH